jgi:hypothetical protein
VETATRAPATSTKTRYIRRGRNQLHTIFDRHLEEFCDVYDEKYATKYGMFRPRLIRLLVEKKLLAEEFARNLLSWRNSGFSIDNSVRLTDVNGKESLAEDIARPPLSLKKIRYEPFKGKVLFHTNVLWSQMPHVAARAPEGWRTSHSPEASAPQDPGFEPPDDGEEVTVNARKRAWARLLAKVYEIAPMVCPRCGWEDEVQFRARETADLPSAPHAPRFPA